MQKLSSSTPTLRAFTVLGLSLTVLLSYNFMSAALTHDATYTDAPTNPPNKNVPAPINVGTSTDSFQSASGTLQLDFLGARDTVVANVGVRSRSYCDLTGDNCIEPATGGGNQVVYLPELAVLYPVEDYKNSNVIEKTYNLSYHGYPVNVSRVFLVLDGNGREFHSYHKEGSDITEVTAASPYFGVYTPFAQNPTQYTVGSGYWVDIKDGVLQTRGQCDYNCGGTITGLNGFPSSEPDMSMSVAIGGYECTGACQMGVAHDICTVSMTWNINSSAGSVAKNVISGAGDMAIGMYYDKDNWDSPSIPMIGLDQNSWGHTTFDSSEKGRVGYVQPEDYVNLKTVLTSWDASSHAVIKTLPVKLGSKLTITSEGVDDVPAGTVTMSAEVISCSGG